MEKVMYFENELQQQPYSILLGELPYNEWVPFYQGHGFSDGFLLKRLSNDAIKLVHYWEIENEATPDTRYGITLDECQGQKPEYDDFTVDVYMPEVLMLVADYVDREWLELDVADFYDGVHFEIYDRYMANEIPAAFNEFIQIYRIKLADSANEVSEEELTQLFKKYPLR